jgi:hypothetical protein
MRPAQRRQSSFIEIAKEEVASMASPVAADVIMTRLVLAS